MGCKTDIKLNELNKMAEKYLLGNDENAARRLCVQHALFLSSRRHLLEDAGFINQTQLNQLTLGLRQELSQAIIVSFLEMFQLIAIKS
jgi:hypothetical protein